MSGTTPPRTNPTIISKLKYAFADWILIAPHIPKIARYGLGSKIEQSFISVLEMSYRAVYSPIDKKIILLEGSITRLDTLTFFLQIAWENKLIPDSKYLKLSEKIQEIGRDFGSWKKSTEIRILKTKTPKQSTWKK